MDKNNILIKEKEKSFAKIVPVIALLCLVQTTVNFLISQQNIFFYLSLVEDVMIILSFLAAKLGKYKYYDKVLYVMMPASLFILCYRIFLEGGLVFSHSVLWFPIYPLIAAYFTNKKFTYFLASVVSLGILSVMSLFYNANPSPNSLYAVALLVCVWIITLVACKYEDERERTSALIEDKNRRQMLVSSFYATSQVVQSFAHEVNNPLCIAILSLKNLELSGKISAEEHEELGESIGRVRALISNLKIKIDNQCPKINSSKTSAYYATIDVLRFFEKDLENLNVKVVSNLSELKNSSLQIKELEFFEALKQIMQNAIENTTHNDTERHIQIKYYKDIRQLHILDNGPEFESKLMSQLSGFNSTKPGHSGLGLAIAKELFKINQIKLILTSSEKGKVILQFS